ncbi:MAG: LysR substrate-binding domain-containing protein [Maricaulis sp.]|jgi:LysR family hydrogen peroxide-inducible transcriptional activator|nr:LysR substrate-binding domain-containing protein [Maricaulis sp.]
MTQLPTLRQLQFLIALAGHGSFSRAAENCHVTQPTLSAAIKELESILGTVLVERGARQATLTPAGEAAVDRAQRVMSESEDLVTAVQVAGEPLTGPFRLGVIPTIAPFLLPSVLPKLRSRFPKLELFLREDLTARLYDGLRERRLDAALVALPYEANNISSRSIASDEFMFACASDHKLAGRKTLKPADLDEEALLLLEDGHCLRDHALSICSTQRVRSDFAATSLHTLVQMVRSGLGPTLLPKMAVDAGLVDRLGLSVTSFDPPIAGREIGIAWRTGSARADEAAQLGSVIESVLQARPAHSPK